MGVAGSGVTQREAAVIGRVLLANDGCGRLPAVRTRVATALEDQRIGFQIARAGCGACDDAIAYRALARLVDAVTSPSSPKQSCLDCMAGRERDRWRDAPQAGAAWYRATR